MNRNFKRRNRDFRRKHNNMNENKNNNNNAPKADAPEAPEIQPETQTPPSDRPAQPEIEDVQPFEEETPIEAVEEGEEQSEVESLKELLNQKNQEVEKEKKEYLFLMAEFDNFRKRTLRERADLVKTAAEKALVGLLPIVDDFERGLDAIKDTSDAAAVKEGMQLIYNKLLKYLADQGVKPMESTASDFNPDLHDAIAMVPADDSTPKGKVKDTVQKGYTLGDKVLRHAKVVVAQ